MLDDLDRVATEVATRKTPHQHRVRDSRLMAPLFRHKPPLCFPFRLPPLFKQEEKQKNARSLATPPSLLSPSFFFTLETVVEGNVAMGESTA